MVNLQLPHFDLSLLYILTTIKKKTINNISYNSFKDESVMQLQNLTHHFHVGQW